MSTERFLAAGGGDGDYFSVSAEELSDLFDNENIKNGESLKSVREWGGFQGLERKLRTDIQQGITHSELTDLSAREQHFGNNNSITKPMKKVWDLIVGQFEDEILRILCYAAGVSLIMGILTEGIKQGWMEGFAIFVAVIIIVSVTAVNDYQKELQFRKLYATAESRNVNVTREGKIQNISIYDILVGDLLTIETGDIIPVDGIITVSHDIVMDESSATGESDTVKKRVPSNFDDEKINPFMISGTQVLEGSGQCLVLAVGKKSQQGKAKLLLTEDDDDEPTPLQGKLDILAGQIGDYGMLVAKLVFGAMVIHLIVEELYYGNNLFTLENLSHIVEYFIIAVTVVVVAVPEGLPLAVTIALAYSVGKMKDENNLVRVLATCETMGGANNICSDKTGTLTKNDMEVTNLWAFQKQFDVFDQKTLSEIQGGQEKLCVGVCVNSNANPQITGSRFEKIGNKTECALLEMAFKMGYNFQQYRTGNKIIRVVPFSSKKKRMSVVYQLNENTYRIFVKGAPDWLHKFTTSYMDRNGEQQSIDEFFEQSRDKQIKQYADKALRTLLLAYKDIPANSIDAENMDLDLLEEELERDLIVIGVAGISDPIRPEVPDAVAKCKSAGVIVRMVTGDVKDTAVAISKKAGILEPDFDETVDKYAVMTGQEFREFVGGKKEVKTRNKDGEETVKYEVGNINNFQIVYDKTRVIARSSPEDKYLLVTGIKQLGNVVAVTGDGTNDAPALKKSDVGFAMGIAGTEVAKEAAGIILLDDNFKSILTAIKWGRNIFDCIRKFLQFQVTVNIVAMFMVFLGGVVLRESPLTAIQMLWVNLIMDTMASLALATEPPSDELLNRQPYGRHEAMITPVMWRNIISHSVWQICVLLTVLFYGPQLFEVPTGIHQEHWTQENGQHFTMFFNIFVYMQVFNEINARKLKREEKNVFKGFFNNPMFVIVIVFTICVQVLITTYGGRSVRCSELSMHQHIVCMSIGLMSLVIGFVIKLIPEGIFNAISLFQHLPEETGKPNIIHSLRRSRSIISRSNSRLSKARPA